MAVAEVEHSLYFFAIETLIIMKGLLLVKAQKKEDVFMKKNYEEAFEDLADTLMLCDELITDSLHKYIKGEITREEYLESFVSYSTSTLGNIAKIVAETNNKMKTVSMYYY